MKGVKLVVSAIVVLSAIVACTNGEGGAAMRRHWSDSVSAPADFAAWQGGPTIALPADRAAFVEYLSAIGAGYYEVGPGSDSRVTAPSPRPGSPCARSERAIVFAFDSEDGATPRYVAYLADAENVSCVDKQFSYLAP